MKAYLFHCEKGLCGFIFLIAVGYFKIKEWKGINGDEAVNATDNYSDMDKFNINGHELGGRSERCISNG